ncbi:MAG: YbaK/EbsC family protein [archaeon]
MAVSTNFGLARKILAELKIPCQILDHSSYGRKSELVAPLFGIPKKNLLKTLTFISQDGQAILAILPKGSEVDEKRLAVLAGSGKLRLAKAPEVLHLTGSEIGGVTPIGSKLPAVIESSIIGEENVIISGGTPETSIVLSGKELARASKALSGAFSK